MLKKKRVVYLLLFVTVLTSIVVITLRSMNTSQPKANRPELSIPINKPPEAPKKIAKKNRIVIPKIGVDANIVFVGVTKQGFMATPSNVQDVGLFANGIKPGVTGTSVMAGHVDSATGEKSVFSNLKKLEPGDIIQVFNDNGADTKFKVSRAKVYDAQEKPDEVFKSANGSHLNLITCAGTWDKANKQYDSRLVVFADLIK